MGLEVGLGGLDIGEPQQTAVGRVVLDESEFGSHKNGLNVGMGAEAVGNGLVFGLALGSQLLHAAEDGGLGGHGEGFEVVERHFHAGGVGVVAVEKEGVAAGVLELRAAVGGLVLLDGLFDVPEVYAEVAPHSGGGHGVVEVVVAQQVGLD